MIGWPYFPDDPASPPAALGPDVAIAFDVIARLRADRRLRGAVIEVEVQAGGVVILTGLVRSDDVRRGAGAIAWATTGVRDVCNLLRLP